MLMVLYSQSYMFSSQFLSRCCFYLIKRNFPFYEYKALIDVFMKDVAARGTYCYHVYNFECVVLGTTLTYVHHKTKNIIQIAFKNDSFLMVKEIGWSFLDIL